jgi:hypothetical protein
VGSGRVALDGFWELTQDTMTEDDWSQLSHAYGQATDLPRRLEQLAAATDDDWDDLWSHLCHQGTVYSASFAALPYLARTAAGPRREARIHALLLAAAIVASNDVQGDRAALIGGHESALDELRRRTAETLEEPPLPRIEFIYLLHAAMALDGELLWSAQLELLPDGELAGSCPRCGEDTYVILTEHDDPFTTPDDRVKGPRAPRSPITPADPSTLDPVGARLHALCSNARQERVADWILCLRGTSACGTCEAPFAVGDLIQEALDSCPVS